MLLTFKEKQFMMKLLAKQKKSLWNSKEEKLMAEQLYEKIAQNIRNEKTNEMKQSRL